MTIPTEPIESIPRPQKLITAFAQYDRGSLSQEEFTSMAPQPTGFTAEQLAARVRSQQGRPQAKYNTRKAA
jgi:hypothetical protein